MMSLRKSIFLSTILSALFIACEKDETGIPPHSAGNVVTSQLEMGSDYGDQLFFSVATNTLVRSNLKTDWDLGFEASAKGWHVVLNTSLGGAAASTASTSFEGSVEIKKLAWRWDAHSGNLDSTAIGDWRTKQEIYVIDRGFDPAGKHNGYRKIRINNVNKQAFEISVAQVDGSEETSITIKKDSSLNLVCFSFTTNETVPIQPKTENWDLLFTQYIHLFTEPETPYLVTGILTNPERIEVAVVIDKDFSAIQFDDISAYSFLKNVNAIGYDWKYYDFDAASYTVDPSINYIIHTTEGIYYKLHFIDFYTASGEKGAPRFEVQAL